MAEEAKAKKVRIYKFASEHNLSAESLVEFLQKKGYEIKSHMTALTDEMLTDINAHFKKDIEKAEKHYRKISEFQKKRAEKSEQAVKEELSKTEIKVSDEETQVAEIQTTPIESIEEKVEVVETETEEEVLPTEIAEADLVVEEQAVEKEIPEAEELPGKTTEQTNVEVFQTEIEKEIKQRKGLTIVGKMDLGKGKKKEKPRPVVNKMKPAEIEEEEISEVEAAGVGKPALTKEESDAEIKKKRKKPKAKKKVKQETTEEPTVVKKKKFKRIEVDEREVEEAIKRTMLSFDDSAVADRASSRKRKKKEKAEIQERRLEEKLAEKSKIKVTEFIAVSELANLMDVPVADVISKCIGLGIMVSINQRLDVDTITLVADEFGFEVEFQEEYSSDELADIPDDPASLKPRPPVVTIMGHVDHGKTSLLDRIRSANVVAGEAGGITQHIGAYQVIVDGKYITFLDTPGHEAFTAMRARGASVTDIVVLVVAADDAVMPQTVEAINHAQAANVPIIIAINKIDKPGANPDKIKQQLGDRNILVEEWGGKYQCVEISAKTGFNIEELLEKILLEAEVLELKANPDRKARGAVVESQLDKGRGITGTILVQKGVLEIGDPFVAGVNHGRVRAMFDERNKKVFSASPSSPVMVLGFEGAPQAGDTFVVVESERAAREISIKRQQLKREQDQRQVRHITLDEIARQISIGGVKELPLIVKGDVDGSVEALSDSLMKLSNQEVIVRVIHKGVGQISEGDVLLASASSAIIVGFHVRPNLNARKLAENENVDIRLYNVIYDAINEVKSALEGLLSPVISEEITATVEVREIFKVPKAGTVAGCYVQEGKIQRTNKVRLIRQGIVAWEGELDSLRRFKDDVREVDAGYECGLNLHNFNDIKIGDIVESYKFIETKKKLE
jgi:translation initiation factor IF-2